MAKFSRMQGRPYRNIDDMRGLTPKPPRSIGVKMTMKDTLTLLIALVAIIVSTTALVRTRRLEELRLASELKSKRALARQVTMETAARIDSLLMRRVRLSDMLAVIDDTKLDAAGIQEARRLRHKMADRITDFRARQRDIEEDLKHLSNDFEMAIKDSNYFEGVIASATEARTLTSGVGHDDELASDEEDVRKLPV